jgi:hypothetical protein
MQMADDVGAGTIVKIAKGDKDGVKASSREGNFSIDHNDQLHWSGAGLVFPLLI